MIYITILNFKKKILNKLNLFIWNIAWIGIIVISLRPRLIDFYFINNFGIDIFYILSVISIFILFVICYFSMLNIKILEKKIDTLIRADSLKEIIEKIDKKNS
mgnify:CR=1 FL=1